MKHKRALLVLAPALALAALSFVPTSRAASVSAGWSDFPTGNPSYGSTYEVPTMSYELGGQTYPATCIVTYPDGTETSYSSLTLSMAGEYTLTYSVVVGGKILSIEEKVFVDYPHYSVSKSTSSLSFGTPENAVTKGVNVKLANGDSLRFTKPIRVADLTTDTLLLRGYITPSTLGAVDFSELIITLTDSADPSNYVNLKYYSHVEGSAYSSVMAQTNGNFYAGVHQSQGLHTNDTYGVWSGVVFNGSNPVSYASTAYDASYFTFMLDHATKKAYGTGFDRGRTNSLTEVLDLDNPNQVAVPWSGFESDYVFLSVSAASYSSGSANFVISQVAGISDLSNNVYIDDVAPTIDVEQGFDEMPLGSVGYSYPIPSASAIDLISGEAEVTTSVYYNYFSASPLSVAVRDHSFYMDRPGAYSIVYEAKDRIGNVSRVVKTVNVFTELGTPTFEIPELPKSVAVGSKLSLPKDIAVAGGSGSSAISVRVEHDGVTDFVEDGYRFTTLSKHKVIYTATDYIGQTSERSVEITPYDGGLPILEDEIVFPRYAIEGGQYELPKAKCYRYQGGSLIQSDVAYRFTDSTGEHDAGGILNPKISAQGEVIDVKAVYGGTVLQQASIPGIKAWGTSLSEGAINLPNYFLGDHSERTLLEEGMSIAYKDSATMDVSFVNPLLTNAFSATLKEFENVPVSGKLSIRLTDEFDPNRFVEASIERRESGSYLIFAGKEVALIGLDLKGDTSLAVNFDGQTLSVGSYAISLERPVDFLSGKSYVDLRMENAVAGTSFVLYDLATYVFRSTAATDRIRPIILAPGDHGGCFEIGSSFTIDPAFVGDVLSPNCDMTLTVTGPDENPIQDEEGNLLDGVDPSVLRSIKLDSYGQYYFLYTATESSSFLARGNKATLSFYISVLDSVAPKIDVRGSMPKEAHVGDVVCFPDFSVSDNLTASENITVIKTILSPNGDTITLSGKENGIRFGMSGTYRFRIMVIDEAGNVDTVSFSVLVTPAESDR